MFTAEFIIGLWFLPVALFVLIPLAMLSVYSLYKALDVISQTVQSYQRAGQKVSRSGYTSMRTREAV